MSSLQYFPQPPVSFSARYVKFAWTILTIRPNLTTINIHIIGEYYRPTISSKADNVLLLQCAKSANRLFNLQFKSFAALSINTCFVHV